MGTAGNGTRRWALVALTLAVLAGACGSNSVSGSGSEAGQGAGSAAATESTEVATTESADAATDDSTAEIPDGVLASWTVVIPGDDVLPPVAPEGDLSITKCSWHGPGRLTVGLAWQSDPAPTPEQPIDVPLVIGFGADPGYLDRDLDEPIDGPRYGFNVGIARLIGNGPFTIPVSGSRFGPTEVINGWWAINTNAQFAPSGLCGILVPGFDTTDPDFAGGVEIMLDPLPLEVGTGTGTGIGSSGETVESLALQVPLTPDWREHSMAALAVLAASDGVPVDQLFFDPARPIGSVDVKHIPPCVAVTIGQAGGTIRQTRDCESVVLKSAGQDLNPADATRVETPDNDSWRVEAFGPAGFTESIRAHAYIGGVDAMTANRLDREAAVALGMIEGESAPSEEQRAPDGWTALGPYELIGGAGRWQGEVVEVWLDQTQSGCCLNHEAVVDGFNGGSTGQACRDWAISLHDDGQRGFLVAVVAGEQTVQFFADAEPRGVPLQPTADEASTIRAGAVGVPFDFSAEVDWLSRVQVLEPDGSRSPCVQN